MGSLYHYLDFIGLITGYIVLLIGMTLTYIRVKAYQTKVEEAKLAELQAKFEKTAKEVEEISSKLTEATRNSALSDMFGKRR